MPVIIDMGPGEIETDGQVMIVKGRGWPKKRDGDGGGGGGATRGDLRVTFRIVSDAKAERIKKGKKAKKRRR